MKKDETVRASQGQGVVDQFEVVGIDAALLLEEKSLGRVLRVVENLGKDRRYLILTLEGQVIEEEAAKAFVRGLGLNVSEISKLSRRIDEPQSSLAVCLVEGEVGLWRRRSRLERRSSIWQSEEALSSAYSSLRVG